MLIRSIQYLKSLRESGRMTSISNIMGDVIGAVFWSLILSSLIISIMGVQKRTPVWLIIGAILAVPLSLYLNMFPLFRYIGLLLPLFQLGASIAIHGIRGSCFDKNNTEGNT